MSYILPIVLIVASNIVYQLCTKAVPKSVDPLASLTVTYLTGAICSAILYFILNGVPDLIAEYKRINLAPFILGISVVGLEAGFIYAYKAGWQVSTLSIVQSIFLTIALILIGVMFYKEAMTASKIIGIIICLVGLYFINR